MNGLMIAYVVISVLIVILVLAQKSRDNGFSTMTGAKPSDGREVGKTFEKKMQVWTTWLVVAYIILSIVFTFYQTKLAADEESADEKPRTEPPRLSMAASKDKRVRVLGS